MLFDGSFELYCEEVDFVAVAVAADYTATLTKHRNSLLLNL
jgi:hypothetical protein